ncbi:serpin B7 isoform X3 [Prionailurus iriomotensis]
MPHRGQAAHRSAMASLAAANAEFCINLFREMDNSQGNGNVFFSSLSIFTALALVRLGARGDCASQIDKLSEYLLLGNNQDGLRMPFFSKSRSESQPSTLSSFNAMTAAITAENFVSVRLWAELYRYLICCSQ